jgi:hypothetical protein
MKKRASGVGGIASIVVVLAFATLTAISFFLEPREKCLRLWGNCYVKIENGNVWIFSDLDDDNRPLVVAPLRAGVTNIRANESRSLPGLEVHYCEFVSGSVVYSLNSSLFIPTGVALALVALFTSIRRARARRARFCELAANNV